MILREFDCKPVGKVLINPHQVTSIFENTDGSIAIVLTNGIGYQLLGNPKLESVVSRLENGDPLEY